MSDGIYNAASGMFLEQKRQEVIANNLAAINLPGYKGEYISSGSFKKKLDGAVTKQTDGEPKVEMASLQGSSDGKVFTDFSSGSIKQTMRPLDFTIQGDGFFEVKTPLNQTLYTRNGAFHLSPDGVLMTAEGYKVSGSGGDIQFATDDIIPDMQVAPDGRIRIVTGGTVKDLGSLKIVGTDNPGKLKRFSSNYFSSDDDPLSEITEFDKTVVMNNYLESGNISPIQSMATMISSMREYEANKNVLKMLTNRFKKELSTFK